MLALQGKREFLNWIEGSARVGRSEVMREGIPKEKGQHVENHERQESLVQAQ